MSFLRRLVMSAAACTLFNAPAAFALSYNHIGDLTEIVQTSPLSFRGRVTAIAHRSIAIEGAARRQPYLEITFQVTGAYSGGLRSGQSFVLRQMGGRSAENPDLEQIVPGLARFEVGVEYAVFTNDRANALEGARWGEHGVLRIADDGAGRRVVLNAFGRPLVADGAGRLLTVRDLRCAAFADAGRRCAQFVSEQQDVEADDGVDLPGALGIGSEDFSTVETLDLHVRSMLQRRAPIGPALSANASRAAYETALRAALTPTRAAE